MKDLAYPIFYAIVFAIIGHYAVDAYLLWDSRISQEIARAVMR